MSEKGDRAIIFEVVQKFGGDNITLYGIIFSEGYIIQAIFLQKSSLYQRSVDGACRAHAMHGDFF